MESVLNFCKKENIGFNDTEKHYYKVRKSRKDHKLWSNSMNSLWQREEDPDGVKAIIKELQDTSFDRDAPEV